MISQMLSAYVAMIFPFSMLCKLVMAGVKLACELIAFQMLFGPSLNAREPLPDVTGAGV